jgi:hypothetical protein
MAALSWVPAAVLNVTVTVTVTVTVKVNVNLRRVGAGVLLVVGQGMQGMSSYAAPVVGPSMRECP